MNPETIIAQLEQINCWRRGEESEPQPDPKHFGDVLDAAAESLASLVASNTTLRRERREARAELKQRKADVTRMEEYLRNSGRNMDEAQEQIAGRDSKIVTLSDDLARVTAERRQEYDELREASSKRENALRARVAEVEKEAMILRGTVEAVTTQRQQAEQRNADLVAALWPLAMVAKYCGQINDSTGVWSHTSIIDGEHFSLTIGDCRRARATLARAESATPAKHPDTEIVDWLEVDPQARLAEVRRLIFTDRDTVREAVHAARKQEASK